MRRTRLLNITGLAHPEEEEKMKQKEKEEEMKEKKNKEETNLHHLNIPLLGQ
jgi:hypothetical protein